METKVLVVHLDGSKEYKMMELSDIPGHPTLTPPQLREEAYNTQAIISWDSKQLTVTQAAQQWAYYAAEGDTAKTDALTALIAEAKSSIREQYPDDDEV